MTRAFMHNWRFFFSLPESAGLDPEDLMRRLAAYGIAYHFASINNSTDIMISIFKAAYLAAGGEPEHFQVLRLSETSSAFWQHRPGTPPQRRWRPGRRSWGCISWTTTWRRLVRAASSAPPDRCAARV